MLKLSLKVTLGITYSLIEKVEHFSFFRGEIVIIKAEFSYT